MTLAQLALLWSIHSTVGDEPAAPQPSAPSSEMGTLSDLQAIVRLAG